LKALKSSVFKDCPNLSAIPLFKKGFFSDILREVLPESERRIPGGRRKEKRTAEMHPAA
jgi:hypothetical protein